MAALNRFEQQSVRPTSEHSSLLKDLLSKAKEVIIRRAKKSPNNHEILSNSVSRHEIELKKLYRDIQLVGILRHIDDMTGIDNSIRQALTNSNFDSKQPIVNLLSELEIADLEIWLQSHNIDLVDYKNRTLGELANFITVEGKLDISKNNVMYVYTKLVSAIYAAHHNIGIAIK